MQKQSLLFSLPERKTSTQVYRKKKENPIEKYEVIIDRSKCDGCGVCIEACRAYIGSAQINYEAFSKSDRILSCP